MWEIKCVLAGWREKREENKIESSLFEKVIFTFILFQGVMAIWSPETGIVDFVKVTKSYASNFEHSGGRIHTNFCVIKFKIATEETEYPVLIFNKDGKVSSAGFNFLVPFHFSLFLSPLSQSFCKVSQPWPASLFGLSFPYF